LRTASVVPRKVTSPPRLWSWAPVSRSICLRLAFRSPNRLTAISLSPNTRRSIASGGEALAEVVAAALADDPCFWEERLSNVRVR
jgi:hypothetical protein